MPVETINRYKDLKMKRLGASPFDRYQRMGEMAGAAAAIVAALFLIILASLVLVLLAIERNTR